MGLLDNYRAKREAKRKRDNESYVNERTNTFANGVDPASTALLYTTVASSDVSDQADDTALDDTDNDALDSYDSETDRYNTGGTDYGTDYTAPTYDFSSSSDSSSSYDSGSSSSYDSGSSDSGSSFSSD